MLPEKIGAGRLDEVQSADIAMANRRLISDIFRHRFHITLARYPLWGIWDIAVIIFHEWFTAATDDTEIRPYKKNATMGAKKEKMPNG